MSLRNKVSFRIEKNTNIELWNANTKNLTIKFVSVPI